MMPDRSKMARGFLAAWTLADREVVRFLRQRNRVFGALAQPVLFWAIFGAGLRASFRPGPAESTVTYTQYFFPGTVVLILLFTAIFATISIIEDRTEGFLQSVLVAPVPISSLVLGKLLGTTILAVGQGILIFLLAPMVGLPLSLLSCLLAFWLLVIISFGLTGLGFAIAWNMDSTQGFHAIMTAFLMPMWLLSGAFFPMAGAPSWLGWIIALNPLTYGVAALRRSLYLERPEVVANLPSLTFCLTVMGAFTVAMFLISVLVARRPTPDARGS